MVPIHAGTFRFLTGFPCTDALNGFRAYKLEMFFDDPRINVWQDWLGGYEFETYLHYKVLKLGYRVTEVPVTKRYSHFGPGSKYSHIRPLVDWWHIMRPLMLLSLGIRK
jgi:dolichol-phosphate mannosyltransferase